MILEREKPKFPRHDAIIVARELCQVLKPVTDRLIVAGSLRRKKDVVGDVEIVFIPKFREERDGLFDTVQVSQVDAILDGLLQSGSLKKRLSKTGSPSWGDHNKLAVHCSGIPVDLFATSEDCWFNYLVCRTGPARSNIAIANAATEKGLKWNPYGPGFTNLSGDSLPVTSEQEVFEKVGLEYLPPEARGGNSTY